MTHERQARAQEIFLSLCDVDPVTRDRLISERCGGDAELSDRVRALLELDQAGPSNDGFLERPALGRTLEECISGVDVNPAGSMIARGVTFHLVRRIGEGGMGVVYEAEQSSPRRRVAVKLMRTALPSNELRRRFHYEGEFLGRLRHPGIACIHETGIGSFRIGEQVFEAPYLAMEYIEGTALMAHAESRRLDIRARVELMAEVCDAVQHAHERGIIHRDLKPANILVDATGQPRVLDFGVAKVLDADAQISARLTQSGQLVGTPAYMSPEQVGGALGDLDTRADVYAIGVMLYELLSGRLPLDVRDVPFSEVARRIREEEPAPLSRTLPSLRGDLTAITAKALEKDRARRYASAAELGEDLRRYLRNDPILARPITATYLLGKFVRRHRGVVITASIVAFSVLGGLSYGLWQARRGAALAREAEAAARLESARARAAELEQSVARAEAEAAAGFMQTLLEGVGPAFAQGRDVSVLRDMFDEAGRRIEAGELASTPRPELSLRFTIADMLLMMNERAKAARMLAPTLELAESLGASGEEFVATACVMNGHLADANGDVEVALRLHQRALDIRVRRLGPEDLQTAESMASIANLHHRRRELNEAVAMHRKVLAIRRDRLGVENPSTLRTMNNLAAVLAQLGRREEAGPLYQEALDVRTRVLGDSHPDVAFSLHNLATFLSRDGTADPAEIESLFRQALSIREKVLGRAHPLTAITMSALGAQLLRMQKPADAEVLLRGAIDILVEANSADQPTILFTYVQLGQACLANKKLDESVRYQRLALAIAEKVYGKERPEYAKCLISLATALDNAGQNADASTLRDEAIAILTRLEKGDGPVAEAARRELDGLTPDSGQRQPQPERSPSDPIRN